MYWKTFTAYFNDFHQTLLCILLPSKHAFSQAKPNLVIISSETPFRKNSCHTETSELIYEARQLVGFYMIRVFTEGYFGIDQNTTGLEPTTTQFLNEQDSLGKWLSVRLRNKWLRVRVQLQSLKLQISRQLRARNSLTFRQLQILDSL